MRNRGQQFLDRLSDEILVGDGAFGTRLYELGIGFDTSYEQFNLTRPELVEQILREYRNAGAEVLETNSFCLNQLKQRNFGLDGQIREMARAAARIAKSVAGSDRFVAGSIGPLSRRKRDLDEYSPAEIQNFFREPMEVLVEEGADVLILETFTSLSELEIALSVARGLDVPVVCQMAFGEEGTTTVGITADKAAKRLEDAGAHVVGANCRSGPLVLADVLDRMMKRSTLPLSVFPNAGYPQQVDGRYVYQADPSYFGDRVASLVASGAALIGGCCGTTAEHVRAIARAASQLKPSKRLATKAQVAIEAVEDETEREAGKAFRKLLSNSEPFVTVEIEPPKDFDLKKTFDAARRLAKAGCDALNVPDNPLAVVRVDNVIYADLLRQHVDVPVVLHLTCRDKNTIALQSDLLGAQMVGIEAVLAVTGDPAAIGDQPGASSVYDINSIGLVDLIRSLNQGHTPSGKVLEKPTDFAIGVALNANIYGERSLEGTLKRLKKKVEAGAHFAQTQPMFDVELIRRLLREAKGISIPICIGILPVVNRRNAEFLHHEVPGIKIPENFRNQFEGLSREEGEQKGIELSKELIDVAWDEGARHFYLVPPFGRYQLGEELARYIKAKRSS